MNTPPLIVSKRVLTRIHYQFGFQTDIASSSEAAEVKLILAFCASEETSNARISDTFRPIRC